MKEQTSPRGHWPRGKRRNAPDKQTERWAFRAVDRAIAAAGSATKVAKLLGVDHGTVCKWKRRVDVPSPQYVVEMEAIAT